ncbi:sugar ABC transporter ATP-binding protein [Actinokineospora sp. NBRC 105648]|uniref:sugar ABC transporter ATP-binding protein n=1 Tax=Actinokineospora sp. NBRC 105648 TaxID=3032206 RepID=UPI002556C551|nr:sugar ABC transporter ATP-binding protein [Actinokineospora sp. NBRC 105648]
MTQEHPVGDPPALRVEAVRKSYGPNAVLKGIDFELRSGEIAAVLGENGAGKSTLARVLAGSIQPDSGSLSLGGRPVQFASPRDALRAGVAFIPQELIYIPDLSVAENICLGNLRGSRYFSTPGRILRQAAETARRFDIELPLRMPIARAPLAVRQKVEILKALGRDSRVLILDEPTAALTNDESDALLELTASLARRGLAVLYISHRLDEVKKLCRTAHVLRDGLLVATHAVADTPVRTLVAEMLGREPTPPDRSTAAPADDGAPGLALRGVSCPSTVDSVEAVALTVGPHEVVTVYGRRGSGADTLAECLGGLHREATGTFELFGRRHRIFRTPRAARVARVAYVPAERKTQGLLLKTDIATNLTQFIWTKLGVLGVLTGRAERRRSRALIQRFGVRCRAPGQAVGDLSGGNQQKVMIASRLAGDPVAAVLHEPTRGVDIGARGEIHGLLHRVAERGVPILIVTSDIEEATTIGDRLLIMRGGRIVDRIDRPSLADQAYALQTAGGDSE